MKQPETTAAKTVAQRQEALRKRRADEGLTEVRGVYAKPAHHTKIKAFAKALEASATMPKRSKKDA